MPNPANTPCRHIGCRMLIDKPGNIRLVKIESELIIHLVTRYRADIHKLIEEMINGRI